MRYTTNCFCLSLRYGVILIGVIDILLAALSIGIELRNLVGGPFHHQEKHGKNNTGSMGKKSDRDGLNVGALIATVAQAITIITAIILIVVGALHRAKLRRLLLIWLGWTIIGVFLILVGLILRVAFFRSNYIDIIISLVICAYAIACFWFVLSYYKFLDPMANYPGVHYDTAAKDNEFLASEKEPAPGD